MTALLVARPLFPSESAAAEGDGLPMVMLWIALAVAWLLGAIGRPRVALRFGWMERLVLALVAWHTVAGVWAAAHESPRPAINMLWEWIGLGLGFLLVRQLVVGRREARAVMAVMLGLVFALSAYGMVQFFVEGPATRDAYHAHPDRMLQDAGIWYPPGSPEREAFEKRLYSQEPPATFALANTLAGLIVPWLVVAVGIALTGWTFRSATARPHPVRVWLALAAVVAGASVCLLLTKSRTGFIAAGVGAIGVGWAIHGPRGRVFWKIAAGGLAGLAVLAGALTLAGGLDRQVFSEAGKSLGYRGQYWQASTRLALDRPWFGAGPGNFQFLYTKYKLPEASEEIAEPHNLLMELWATAGTPALVLLLSALAVWGWTVARAPAAGTAGEGALPAWQTPADPSDPPAGDHPGFVLGGALAGYLLGLPLALLSAAPPNLTVWWLGLPAAAVVVALAWQWIRDGSLPLAVPVAATVALLVNLLAAGALGFPALSGSLWLLVAISMNLAQSGPPRGMRRASVAVLLVPALSAVLVCYLSAYRPVLESQRAMRQIAQQPAEAERWLEAAAKADPLAVQPWQQLAVLSLQKWKQESDEASLATFDQAARNAMRLEPHSARLRQILGDGWSEIAEQTHDPTAIQQAQACYREGVRLYPTSAILRAKLARMYYTARQFTLFQQEAKEALALDRKTPHEDKKLPAEIRQELESHLAAFH